METLLNCPVCNGNRFEKYLDCVDYTVSRETFSIVRCSDCSFLFTNPRPQEEEIGMYYESPEYISHSNSNEGIINKVYQSVRNKTIKSKLALVHSLIVKNGKNILDIGCGTGEFLNACKKSGFVTEGIEPGANARNQAITNFKLSVHDTAYLNSLPPFSQDIITMWHVLEHVHELNGRMEELYSLLKEDGKVIIAVPNCASYDAKKYKQYWAAYDVPRHLYHFTPETMKRLVEKKGFKIEQMLPMKYDSFYVSMLSEKYKTKRSGLFKAFVTGFISNVTAGKNNAKYSSVIYILKKA